MKKLIKIWCWLVGHNLMPTGRMEMRDEYDRPISQWGGHECLRCKEQFTWNYDN